MAEQSDFEAYLNQPTPPGDNGGRALLSTDYNNYLRMPASGPRINAVQRNMQDWYVPQGWDRNPVKYDSNMPGMNGVYNPPEGNPWKGPGPADTVTLNPWPDKYIPRHSPFKTAIHEFDHQYTYRNVPDFNQITDNYFKTDVEKRKFIDKVSGMVGLDIMDAYTLDGPLSFTKNPKVRQEIWRTAFDEAGSRLMAHDAMLPRGENIYKHMSPNEINWFLETSRRGWNPKK